MILPLLGTLHARALDSQAPHSILRDEHARTLVERLDYDFATLGLRPLDAMRVAVRAAQLDAWAEDFMRRNPDAVVLHLACGLDTRFDRLQPPPGVRWYDLDLPEVIELRRRLLPAHGNCHVIASSVLDPAWLTTVPDDSPVLVIAEGLTQYLPKSQGTHLLRTLADRFPRGEMIFDIFSRLAIRTSRLVPAMRRADAQVVWGIDDPHALGHAIGAELIDEKGAVEMRDRMDTSRMPRSYRILLRSASCVPAVQNAARLLRYRFL
jgi:O-methyltransferase involved in polyketide biosynthesis